MQESSFSEFALSNGALSGAYVVSGDSRVASDFVEKYQREYGIDVTNESDLAVYGYGAIELILEGLKSGNTQEFLSSLKDFKSSLGPISADGYQGFTFPVVLKEFTKDGFRYLDH